ncbi:MAG: response regulator transcription factor [Ignavibacteria bacterium]|jgi:DNA-binding NarL/FixJ family response regulator|nr:response regulator transcription factor [Ignavibacteria bacterium]
MKKTNAKIRLLLIEDNKILRNGMAALLKPHLDIKIISTSGNKESTILQIHKLKPNVILIDLGLRSRNSLHMVEVVKKEFPDSKLIVMDLVPVQADILQFIKAGASGFILKDASLADFLSTIRSVSIGEKVLPENMTESLFSQIIEFAIKKGNIKVKEAVRMTKREKEVIELISDAMTNKEIATKLKISAFTVKSHVHNILEKLALHSRLEVANFSASEGSIKSIADSISIIQN